jgi:hypothetical protein
VDKAKATQLWGQAAEQGDVLALGHPGACHANGTGMEKDKAKAAHLWGKAAEQGDAMAQHALGLCYNLGQGVEVDKTEAVKRFRQAAEQGYAVAQWTLGLCYEHGRGVPHDMGAAVALYRQAIEVGGVRASASLGLCSEKGRGVLQSLAEAERLYKLAAKSGWPTLDSIFDGAPHLLVDGLAPNVPSAAARAHIQFVVYTLNLLARKGNPVAVASLESLARRRDVVSACCVGCGAGAQAQDVLQVPRRALLRYGVHSARVARAQGELQGVVRRRRPRRQRRVELGGS